MANVRTIQMEVVPEPKAGEASVFVFGGKGQRSEALCSTALQVLNGICKAELMTLSGFRHPVRVISKASSEELSSLSEWEKDYFGIVDHATGTSYQLCFFSRFCLIMHAAQSTFFLVKRNIALHQIWIQTVSFEFPAAKRACKKTAFIFYQFRFDNEHTFQLSFCKNHGKTSGSGMGIMNLPPQPRISDICSMISSFRFHGKMNRKSGLVSLTLSG